MKIDVRPTVEQLAEAFCELSDDEQTRFFASVANVMATWLPHQRLSQLSAIGRHLKDCTCGSDGAIEVISAIHEAMVATEIQVRR